MGNFHTINLLHIILLALGAAFNISLLTDEVLAQMWFQGPQGLQGERGYNGTRGLPGPPGPPGPQGEAGLRGERGENGTQSVPGSDSPITRPQIRYGNVTLEIQGRVQAEAACNSTERVIGGGYRILDGFGIVLESYPQSNSWLVTAVNPVDIANTTRGDLQAYAVCDNFISK